MGALVVMLLGAPAANAQTDASGALEVQDAGGLEELPPPVAGSPLYPRVRGHIPYGLTVTSWPARDERRFLTPPQIAQLHGGMGASIARMPLYWPHVEPSSGARRWDIYDEVYRALVARGVRPLWTIYQTPAHAVAPQDRFDCNAAHCDDEPAGGQEWRLTRLGADLARRYPLAAGFEFRNEPNWPIGFGNTRISADRYVALLDAFRRGVQQGRPSARVIGGALVMNEGFPAYLRRMLELGAANMMDALSFHPYANSGDEGAFASLFGTLRSTLEARGAQWLRLFPDEAGASTAANDLLSIEFDEAGQRDLILSQYRALDTADPAVPLSHNVDAFVLFTDVDGPDDTHIRGYGFLRKRLGDAAMEAKLVYCSFRNEVAGLDAALSTDVGSCPAVGKAATVKKKTTKKKKKAKRCYKRSKRTGKRVRVKCRAAKKKPAAKRG